MIIDNRTEFLHAFDALAQKSRKVLIMSHMNPDDDSISSVLTVYTYLSHHFPNLIVDIVYSGKKESRWEYFENYDRIQYADESTVQFSAYDMFIGVDACNIGRFIQNVALFASFSGNCVFVDHHQSSPDSNTISLVDPEYGSCAELLYEIFYAGRSLDSVRLYETILLGILGDTGTFRYIKPTQSQTFLVAERLVREGNINIQDLQSHYSTYTEQVMSIIQELVSHISYTQIGSWPRCMYSYLSREFIKTHSLSDNDITPASGIFIAQYGTSLRECSWSMVFTPRANGSVSCSLRSRPRSVNVRMIGTQMGLGGGHDRAAGLKFPPVDGVPADVNASITTLFNWLEVNEPLFC